MVARRRDRFARIVVMGMLGILFGDKKAWRKLVKEKIVE
jgi:hypothetical protein